jgi:hypothetical protein
MLTDKLMLSKIRDFQLNYDISYTKDMGGGGNM